MYDREKTNTSNNNIKNDNTLPILMEMTHRGLCEYLQHKVAQFRKNISQRDLMQTVMLGQTSIRKGL